MTNFANRLKTLRNEKGVTQAELAKYLNVSQNAVYNWENEKREPNIKSIERLAKYFNVSASYLIGWDKEIDATISKELQISKDALYIINKFPLTIDKYTGRSLMDVFNALIINDKFPEILRSILSYISRQDEHWDEMVSRFSQEFEPTDKALIQSLCRGNIIEEFNSLLADILTTNIDIFNRLEKTPDGDIVIGIKPKTDPFTK